jgi:eukaryotic-like serine/threonine-protein kinase
VKTETRKRVLEILDATLAEPPSSRPEFLAQACGDDDELRLEVESLLALEDEADRFLPESAVPGPGQSGVLGDGLRIGPYRVLERIGRGGMGTVYKAVREDDFEKQVALKLLQSDLVSESNVRRFHNERQILARLEHPAIARLLDGGSTDDGRPYLVMEHVDGVPIDRYCDDHRLSTRARLELFLKVCSALAFAHQSLVVHRDLKPGNILITEHGAPKLLDFGIAKLLDPDDATRRDLTRGAEQPMTPRYASPEQVRRQPITTVSDIYALGVLLYRLLTGRLPCGLEGCRFGEIPWRIVEADPVKPSAVVGREEAIERAEGELRLTPEEVSATRDGDPIKLRRRLAGDVDAIVLKALRKEPRYRYSSVEQMAEDIRRHLDGRPVAARRGTLLYRTGKFVRRHRLGVAAGLLASLALVAFLVRERQRLEADRMRSDRVIKMLSGLIDVYDPDREEELTASLEKAREELAVLEDEPDLHAEMSSTLARIHRKLGHRETAWELMRESLEIWRRHYPEDLAGRAERINNLGAMYLDDGDYDSAEASFREALALREQLGDESGDMVYNLNNLATVLMYRGLYGEAEELYRRGLKIRRRSHEEIQVSASLRSLGAVLLARGDVATAEPLLREALEIRLREYGAEDTRVTSVLDLLARVRLARGDPWEAEKLYRRSRDILSRRLGEDHADVLWSDRNLALLLMDQGELSTARVIIESAYDGLHRALPPEHWRVAAVDVALGALLSAEGRYAEAEPCLVDGYEGLRAIRGEHSTYTHDARYRIYQLYEEWGRPEKAAPFKLPAPDPSVSP